VFQHILVPLDGSELAERALPVATCLASAPGVTLYLVRVVELLAAPLAMEIADLPQEAYEGSRVEQVAHAYLERLAKRLRDEGHTVQTACLRRDVSSSLLDYERERKIDLVVLCSHGRSGVARFALGSVAARLVRHGIAPVLVLHAFSAPPSLQDALVPLDGSPLAEEALRAVNALAPAVLRSVTLLRVLHSQDELPEAASYLHEVTERLRPLGITIATRIARGDPAHEILKATRSNELVVMATHGRTGVRRWALGSVADRVSQAGASVLLMRMGPHSHGVDQEGSTDER